MKFFAFHTDFLECERWIYKILQGNDPIKGIWLKKKESVFLLLP